MWANVWHKRCFSLAYWRFQMSRLMRQIALPLASLLVASSALAGTPGKFGKIGKVVAGLAVAAAAGYGLHADFVWANAPAKSDPAVTAVMRADLTQVKE